MSDSDDTTGEMSDGLQVELFHPESDREPGDTNIERFGFDVHPVVFPISLAIIVVFVGATVLFQDSMSTLYGDAFSFVNGTFGWFYILAVNIFILTILFFAFSRYGNIKIGGVEAEKEFSDFSWMAMLFSAGMGIGLMFFSVTEPMGYLTAPPAFFGVEAGRDRQRRDASDRGDKRDLRDGAGRDGPESEHLAAHVPHPGVDLRDT